MGGSPGADPVVGPLSPEYEGSLGEVPVQVREPGVVGLEDPRGLHALVVQRHGVVGVGAEEPVEHRAAVVLVVVEPLVPRVSNSCLADPRDDATQFPHALVNRPRCVCRGILQGVQHFARHAQAQACVRGLVVRLPVGFAAGGIGFEERAQPEFRMIVFQPFCRGPPHRGSFSPSFCPGLKVPGCHYGEVGEVAPREQGNEQQGVLRAPGAHAGPELADERSQFPARKHAPVARRYHVGAGDSRALRLGVLFLYHERAPVCRRSAGLDMDECPGGVAVDGGGVGTDRSGGDALRFSQRRHRTRVPLWIGVAGPLDRPVVHVAIK